MRTRLTCFLLLTMPLWSWSQGGILSNLIETAPHANTELIQSKITDFISLQKGKRQLAKNEIKFLKAMVNDSHKKFLKSYKPYSYFNELFENGRFDCLTGTSFFCVMLDELDFKYKIVETNYHIFLLIETNQGRVLLETTDRLFGFKTNQQEIEKCLSHYKENLLTSTSSNKYQYYQYHVELFREVSTKQLSGLLYFNQAVIAYNNHDWVTCVDRLAKARSIYDNPRVEELTEILADSIAASELNEKVKQQLLIYLAKHVQDLPALAVR
jgi:hypothetical protein